MSFVHENRPGRNERQAFLQDRAHSSATFVHLVWPVLQKQCPAFHEGVLRLVEGRDHDLLASELDTCAGIDAYQRTAFGLRGIGVRVQWNINYHTFTVRLSRPSGALTECRKRLLALTHREEGFLYPHSHGMRNECPHRTFPQ